MAIVVLLICCALSLATCATQPAQSNGLPWADARQLVLVTTPDWNADHGSMRTYARDAGVASRPAKTTPVVIGRAGAAWGLGLNPPQPGPVKQEGDGRSPAGVFAHRHAHSATRNPQSTGLPYARVERATTTASMSAARRSTTASSTRVTSATAAVAGSTEPMRRDLHAQAAIRPTRSVS